MATPATGSGGALEDRLGLISQMLEEAVAMLRTTMAEVREEAGKADLDDERESRGEDHR